MPYLIGFDMRLEDVYLYFEKPALVYLNQELAVCYVLSVLLKGDSYGTELIQLVESNYTRYRLSDTVLYSALKFLETERLITGYWKKVEGRGRPRRMYQIVAGRESLAMELAQLWQQYVESRNPT